MTFYGGWTSCDRNVDLDATILRCHLCLITRGKNHILATAWSVWCVRIWSLLLVSSRSFPAEWWTNVLRTPLISLNAALSDVRGRGEWMEMFEIAMWLCESASFPSDARSVQKSLKKSSRLSRLFRRLIIPHLGRGRQPLIGTRR